MTANNSCGGRSIRYGIMADNVHSIDAFLINGQHARFADTPSDLNHVKGTEHYRLLVSSVREIANREKSLLDSFFPKL